MTMIMLPAITPRFDLPAIIAPDGKALRAPSSPTPVEVVAPQCPIDVCCPQVDDRCGPTVGGACPTPPTTAERAMGIGMGIVFGLLGMIPMVGMYTNFMICRSCYDTAHKRRAAGDRAAEKVVTICGGMTAAGVMSNIGGTMIFSSSMPLLSQHPVSMGILLGMSGVVNGVAAYKNFIVRAQS